MNGIVDQRGRAVISVALAVNHTAESQSIDAWIDTGFTGDLLLSRDLVDEWALAPSSLVEVVLADGSTDTFPAYSCWIDWFGERRKLEVLATEVGFPLLGVGLLLGHEVRISYAAMTVCVE